MRLIYGDFMDLINHGPFKFDNAWMGTGKLTKILSKTHMKRPISYDCVFKDVILHVEEWMPDNLVLFCKDNEMAAVLDMKTGNYYFNPEHTLPFGKGRRKK